MVYIDIGFVVGIIFVLAYFTGFFIRKVREGFYTKIYFVQDTVEFLLIPYSKIGMEPLQYSIYTSTVMIANMILSLVIMAISIAFWPILLFIVGMTLVLYLKDLKNK